ncbi:MAG: hypothetical protein JWM95_492 [Gemmatimonadetes bacterium]|nr:hypothetical protein [Gemmatimonadota bacterium]
MSADISFLTPYWSGREMMTVHLESVRQFYPDAPIIISKRDGGHEEMDAHRVRFGVDYIIEDCSHTDAVLRLFTRCRTEFACVLDHDVVLLSTLDPYVRAIRAGEYDLVGFEERVREPAELREARIAPEFNGWLRLAPGSTGVNFLIFNLRDFLARYGLRGVRGMRRGAGGHFEYDYGIGQRLMRHKYLLPYHTPRYGVGNLLMDGAERVAWHQWYGSHGRRLSGTEHERSDESGVELRAQYVARTEQQFLADYPHLDFSQLDPAWGPELDVAQEIGAISTPGFIARTARRIRRWPSYGVSGILDKLRVRLSRWQHLLRR